MKNIGTGFFVKIILIVFTAVLFFNNCNSFASSNLGENDRKKMLEEIADLQESAHSLERILELVSEVIKPSVVSITSIKVINHPAIPFSRGKNQRRNPHGNPYGRGPQFRGPQDFFDFFGGDQSERFFKGKSPKREFKQQGLGTGVIVDTEGYILTNNHVVEGADEIKVILGDKREFEGKVIGTDPQSDVAVIKIEGSDFIAAKLGDSDALRVGNWAIAIGNPFGLSQTVSFGVISATGRTNIGIAQYEDMIQTDAAINPGNSGGPLVNIKGEVVGINTAIFTKTGGYQGIGFAIPINMAKVIMESLIKTGRVARGWLGVVIQDLTPALIKQFDVSVKEGVLIADVQNNSPASDAGMEVGDIIIEYESKHVRDVNHLRNVVAQTEIDKEVTVVVLRNGKENALKIKIQEQPSDLFAAAGRSPAAKDIGLTVQNLTKELAKNLNIDESNGVVVTEVVPGSPAAEAEIREGDLIKEVNRQRVENVDEFWRIIKSTGGNDEILFLAKRGDYTRYVILKTPKDK
ncbi:MAG: DegQ family serine endoprotease [Candidatus Anammoxibacter sp.]